MTFYRTEPSKTYPSVHNKWPSRGKNNHFKFDSWYFMLSKQSIIIERSTYGALEWLGDVGGLFDGLYYIMQYVAAPLSVLKMKN